MEHTFDPKIVMSRLKEKKRATADQLQTTPRAMGILFAAGFVAKDGTVPTGKQGRPPIAWIPKPVEERPDAPLPELFHFKRESAGDGISQAAVDAHIRQVLADKWGEKPCTCLHEGLTIKDIRALGAGCTAGRWVCPSLDAVRRRLGAP